MNEKDDEYEAEMTNAVEELKREKAQRRKDKQARKTAPMKFRYQGNINEDESKWLDCSRRRNEPRTNEKGNPSDLMTTRTRY